MNNSMNPNPEPYMLLFEDILNDPLMNNKKDQHDSNVIIECYKDTYALKELQTYKS